MDSTLNTLFILSTTFTHRYTEYKVWQQSVKPYFGLAGTLVVRDARSATRTRELQAVCNGMP